MQYPPFATYSIDPSLSQIIVTFRADPTFLEWLELMNRIFADPGFQKGFGFLIDRRHTPIPATKDIRSIMRYVDQRERAGDTKGWATN